MIRPNHRMYAAIVCLLLGTTAAIPTFAGSAAVGSVAGSMNATVGGQTLLPNTTIFSGDNLQVLDGVAVMVVGGDTRIVLGRDTLATFQRELHAVTVVLNQGNVSVYHPSTSLALRVKVGDVLIQSEPGFKTLSEVAMLNGAIIVTAKEGTVRVDRNGEVTDIAHGRTLTIPIQTKNARAPQVGGSQNLGGGNVAGAVGLAAGGVAAILAGVAISRNSDTKDAAAAAQAQALSARNSANDAAAAAAAAAASANSAGCALNLIANHMGLASPYAPTSGSCQ